MARDPVSGDLGVAVQSHWFSVGSVVTWGRPGVGTVATQSVADPAYGPRTLDRGMLVRVFVGAPEIEGRYFYEPEMRGFNFAVTNTSLMHLLTTLLDIEKRQDGRALYLGSTATAELLPGFAEANPLKPVEAKGADPRIWIGNASRVAPHFDESNNVACVVSGRRRFTLFPPEQIANLYVGPLDQTMAGQPSSMVDLRNPDLERFPRFREAMDAAVVAELEPGDAIFIPSLWWHGVEATGPLNVLVNYWWQSGPMDAGSPMHALGHGLLTIPDVGIEAVAPVGFTWDAERGLARVICSGTSQKAVNAARGARCSIISCSGSTATRWNTFPSKLTGFSAARPPISGAG